jgi:hypothetical protein
MIRLGLKEEAMGQSRSFIDTGLSISLFLIGIGDLSISLIFVLLFALGVLNQSDTPASTGVPNVADAFRALGTAIGFIAAVVVLAQGIIVSTICFALQRILLHVSSRA